MKEIEHGPITFHWTAWEFTSERAAHSAYAKTYHWVKQKPSRSVSVWRLASLDRTHWFVIALSEHREQIEVVERRLARLPSEGFYDVPEGDLIALIIRRVSDALGAVGSTGSKTERHFKGRYKLMPDGSLEPVDRPQG